MKRIIVLLSPFVLFSIFCLFGCSSSEESTTEQEVKTVTIPKDTAHTVIKTEEKREEKTDTVNIMNVQKTVKPPSQTVEVSKSEETESNEGNFAVQIGAFKSKESADRLASISKERFPGKVFIVPDENDAMFKVLIGYFKTKDGARAFRDEINQKFPAEYKDAWVTEFIKK